MMFKTRILLVIEFVWCLIATYNHRYYMKWQLKFVLIEKARIHWGKHWSLAGKLSIWIAVEHTSLWVGFKLTILKLTGFIVTEVSEDELLKPLSNQGALNIQVVVIIITYILFIPSKLALKILDLNYWLP